MKMPKYWPMWLGIFVGLITLSLGIVSSSTLDEGLHIATRWTGRVAFPLFIVTFIASSLATLLPNHWTKAFLRKRRWWGLGFAACFAIHLATMSVYKWRIGEFPPVGIIDPGVLATILLLAMVLTSNNAAQRAMGHGWKWLHRTGMWVFLLNYGTIAMPYMLISFGAACLRIISWWQRKRRRRLANGRYS